MECRLKGVTLKLTPRLLKIHREYNRLHREEILIKNRLYRIKNREKLRKLSNKIHKENKNEESKYRRNHRKNNLKTWINIVPDKTKCQICNRVIYFMALSKLNAIHFDHRHEGNEPIQDSPSRWLKQHPRTPENEKLWIKSDFGFLCHFCNYRLPTKNRKDWVLKMNKYVTSSGDQNSLG